MRPSLVCGLLAWCACGGRASYDGDLSGAVESVSSYEALTTTTTLDPGACAQARGRYLGEVGPQVSRLRGAFDACRRGMGHNMCADVQGELAAYQTRGCEGATPDQNRALALGHCRRMLDLLHQVGEGMTQCP